MAEVPPRVLLVTGASSGIGLACAERLSARGWKVWGAARRFAGTDSAGAAAPSRSFSPLAMDVNSDASVEAGVAKILEAEGRLDAVLAAAGWGISGAIEETSIDEAKRLFETNFFGVMRVCRAALPAMRAHGAGRIVIVGSVAGRIAMPFQAIYSATKFALEGFAEALQMEVAPFGVSVSLIEPGDYRTGFTDARRAVADADGKSPYASARARALEAAAEAERKGPSPEPIARLAEKILSARRPRLRYPIGPGYEGLLAKAVLPESIFRGIVEKHFKLR